MTLFEKELGVQFFDRSPRKIELAKAGRLFVPEANASLTHAECAWELSRHRMALRSALPCKGPCKHALALSRRLTGWGILGWRFR